MGTSIYVYSIHIMFVQALKHKLSNVSNNFLGRIFTIHNYENGDVIAKFKDDIDRTKISPNGGVIAKFKDDTKISPNGGSGNGGIIAKFKDDTKISPNGGSGNGGIIAKFKDDTKISPNGGSGNGGIIAKFKDESDRMLSPILQTGGSGNGGIIVRVIRKNFVNRFVDIFDTFSKLFDNNVIREQS